MGLMLASQVFALDLSAGLALSSGYFFNRFANSSSSLDVSSELINTSLPAACMVFFDGEYFEFAAGYRIRVLGHQKQTTTSAGTTTTITDADTGLKGYAAFSFFLKYPFALGQFVVFPLLGIERDVIVLMLDTNGNDTRGSMTPQQLAPEDQAWIKAGMGAQIGLSNWGYLRAKLVLGWKMPSAPENDAVANQKSSGFDATLFSLEPDLSIAVGLKL
jgi:hypothetical protein